MMTKYGFTIFLLCRLAFLHPNHHCHQDKSVNPIAMPLKCRLLTASAILLFTTHKGTVIIAISSIRSVIHRFY